MSDIFEKPEYGFLKTNPILKDKIILLTYGGSHAYGTNNENSDTDIRGICLNSQKDILGYEKESLCEEVIDTNTDTVIYTFNKMIRLLTACNPNTIEILGCKPEHYFYLNECGKELIENRKMFLSQKAIKSFSGYARQQLARLENALARDRLPQSKKEEHILNSCLSTIDAFEKRYSMGDVNKNFELILRDSDKEDMEKETFVNVRLENVPLREFAGMASDLAHVCKCYGKLNHRNHKKDDAHLNKHAMHLIRLYLMCIDILEKEEIVTYRENDIDFLMSIRNGFFQKEDGSYKQEFFELIKDLEKRVEYAQKNTSLPVHPNYEKINEFVYDVNRKTILNQL